VAVAIGKIDALLFAVGILIGIFLFGVTFTHITSFNLSGHLGNLTIPTWLNLNTGIVVLVVVVLAIAAFWAAEKSEGPWKVFARLYGTHSEGDKRR
jgi:Mn2+/Fe2+ NRAMP family transporter